MLGSIGLPELILVFVVVLLLFGPDKLPHFAKTLGKTVREFRSTVEDAKSAIHDEIEKSTGGTTELREVERDLRQAIVSPWNPVTPPGRPAPVPETGKEVLPPLPETEVLVADRERTGGE
jgi:TatA/E family protein of Tat protein translocase